MQHFFKLFMDYVRVLKETERKSLKQGGFFAMQKKIMSFIRCIKNVFNLSVIVNAAIYSHLLLIFTCLVYLEGLIWVTLKKNTKLLIQGYFMESILTKNPLKFDGLYFTEYFRYSPITMRFVQNYLVFST